MAETQCLLMFAWLVDRVPPPLFYETHLIHSPCKFSAISDINLPYVPYLSLSMLIFYCKHFLFHYDLPSLFRFHWKSLKTVKNMLYNIKLV